jgi:hypothetical protein
MSAVAQSGLYERWPAAVRATHTQTTSRWFRGAFAGAEVNGTSADEDPIQAFEVAETVEGTPARLWPPQSSNSARCDDRHQYGAESVEVMPR